MSKFLMLKRQTDFGRVAKPAFKVLNQQNNSNNPKLITRADYGKD